MNRFSLSTVVLYLFCSASLTAQEDFWNPSKYWIFFKDKGITSRSKKDVLLNQVESGLASRCLKRRAKVRSANNLVDEHDLPVSKSYLNSLRAAGLEPLVVSNWLNGVSVRLNLTQLRRVNDMPFVKAVRQVARVRRKPQPVAVRPATLQMPKKTGHDLDYGASFQQNLLINVPAVHDLGVIGTGVWIGMLDTGAQYHGHDAFEALKVIAEHDFINNDGTVEDEEGQDVAGQQTHGTQTLSVIAGFKEGQLIGSAFGAAFLLAKTELINSSDLPVEEDYWAAGIEWLENQGVDVVSSSVGYLDFYSPSDMDGNTAVTTRAADLAVSRGVVVLNSAGNERRDPWHIIIAPADGDSVIAVGAIDSQGALTDFSSVGPSADGRIKPDVVALGSGVRVALPSTSKLPSSYASASGTSFSAPLVAGVAALVLSAHPNLTPMEVRDALRMTASRATAPDTLVGWGVVDALEAVLFHGTAFSNLPEVSVNNNSNLQVSIKIASKNGVDANKVFLFFAKSESNFERSVAMLPGPEEHQFVATIPDYTGEEVVRFYFMSTDSNGVVAFHPANAPDSTFSFPETPVAVHSGATEIPSVFTLAQNYPNPFNPATKIGYEIVQKSLITLTVHNILGQRVKTLIDHSSRPVGRFSIIWDGTDDAGRRVSAGVYFYRMAGGGFEAVKKMVLVH